MQVSNRTTLYNWNAIRSGNHISIDHSAGKITGVLHIRCIEGHVIATDIRDRQYILSTKES